MDTDNCMKPIFELPESVNATLFFWLIENGEILEAIQLLPPDWQERMLSNSSVVFPMQENCTIIIEGISPEISLILVYSWILIITSIVGVIGNALVVCVYLQYIGNLTPYNWLIVHLGFCDLCFAIVQTLAAVPAITHSRWPFGDIGCKLLKGATQLGSLVAVGTLLVIAVERYMAVLRPLRRHGRGKRVAFGLLIVWLVSLPSVIPSCIAYDGSDDNCIEIWNQPGLSETFGLAYAYYLLMAFFVVPLLFIAISYTRIICYLANSSDRCRLYSNSGDKAVSRRRREDRRVIKILVVVVVVFSLCVLPGKIFWVIVREGSVDNLTTETFFVLVYVGMLPYPFHVAVNPIIYSLIDSTFRERVAQSFKCAKSCFVRKRAIGKKTFTNTYYIESKHKTMTTSVTVTSQLDSLCASSQCDHNEHADVQLRSFVLGSAMELNVVAADRARLDL